MANKNFRKDKYGNRPLDKDIGRVMIKILHSLNVQLKMNVVKSTQSIMLLRGFFLSDISYLSISKEVYFHNASYSTAERCTHIDGYH